MNYPINLQTLKSQLDFFEKTLTNKQKVANQAYFQQLIKVELNKLLKSLPKGVDKSEILPFLEENLKGEKNKVIIIATVKELLDGEAKTITSNLIEQKFGGPEKFQDGVYNAKSEVKSTVLLELKPGGVLLEELHDIFGPDKFYPNEGGENVPKGREGKHLIPADKETLWRDKFGSNVEGAEELYEDAKTKGQSYEKTTKNINPLKHLAEEVDQAHDFIVKDIDLQTDLNKFPTNETIEGAYNEKKVPDTINHEEVQKLRDNRINEIKDSKTNYQGISGIEVLKVNKKDIDTEIAKVDSLVKQINSYQFLRDLDANKKVIDEQFKNLKLDLLPLNKANEITKAESRQREVLNYSLVDPKDGGLEEANLKRLTNTLEDD
ncbi:1178_t:CDS:2 [Paraglomus brasilianum]|uniref:1178_t:CDS:1 n=1 Tax=Paraglomus brasilianum TaxID=144538 RepID=A0A9N9FMU7_9GLOM|nr:1178_t:CDS:2 [Paraglomus brasilianum]